MNTYQDAQESLRRVAAVLGSLTPGQRYHVSHVIGSEAMGQAKRDLIQRHGHVSRYAQSIGYEANSDKCEVFSDLGVFPGGRLRELGGEVRPFRRQFLFIPLRRGARPNDPTLERGVDFILVKRTVHRPEQNIFRALRTALASGALRDNLGDLITDQIQSAL